MNRHQRRLLSASFLGVLAVIFAVLLFRYHGDLGLLAQRVLAQLRSAGPWVFFLGMAILPALGFPLLPFALAAGPAFGPELGTTRVILCAVAAVAANTALSYWLARSVFSTVIRRIVDWLGYTFPVVPSNDAWKTALAVRLAPGLPFWMQSYALGIVGLAWKPYIVVSTLVPAVYLTGAIIAGGAAWRGNAGAAMFGVSVILFAIVLTALWRAYSKKKTAAS